MPDLKQVLARHLGEPKQVYRGKAVVNLKVALMVWSVGELRLDAQVLVGKDYSVVPLQERVLLLDAVQVFWARELFVEVEPTEEFGTFEVEVMAHFLFEVCEQEHGVVNEALELGPGLLQLFGHKVEGVSLVDAYFVELHLFVDFC